MLDEKRAAADPVPLHKTECVPLPLAACEGVPLHREEKVPLDNVVSKSGEGESAAAPPLLFRGAPICWEVSQQTRRVVEKNAFGPDTISERPGRKSNLIVYNGQTYQKEQFYKAVF